MKAKFILSLALCLSLFTVVFAQKGKENLKKDRTAEERATAHTNHLEKRLGLSAEQKTQVYAINLDAAQKHDAIKEKKKTAGADKKALSAERKAVDKDRAAKLEALLTAPQKVKWEAVKLAQKKRVEERKKAKGKGKLAPAGEDLNDDDED